MIHLTGAAKRFGPNSSGTWTGWSPTGVLHFSVSFTLGLWLALRARNLDTRGRKKLVGVPWRELRRHPARFLWRYDEG
jgi:site-specific recombinase